MSGHHRKARGMGPTRVYWQQGPREPLWNDLITRKQQLVWDNMPGLRGTCDLIQYSISHLLPCSLCGLVHDPRRETIVITMLTLSFILCKTL